MLFRNLASMDVEESIRAQPARRRRAAGGLRQDHAGAADGRGERATCPTIGVSGGPMLNGKYRGRDIGSGTNVWRCRRNCAPARSRCEEFSRGRVLHAPLARPLHDHGHRLHHGLDGRGARRRPAGQRRHPGGRCAPQRARAHGRAGASSRWSKRGPRAVEDPDPRGVRERHPRQCRDRRLDQRGDPSDRHRAAASASSSRSTTGTALGRGVPLPRQPACRRAST